MYCPDCKTKLKTIETRHSCYANRKSTCALVAYDIGGDNATGRRKKCPKCKIEYYSVETLEKKKEERKSAWDYE